LDEALRRGEMYHRAGADMLFIHSRKPEELRRIGERLPGPLMMFAPEDGFGAFEMAPAELAKLGFRLAASSGSAFAAMYKAVRQSYECLARGELDPFLGVGGAVAQMKRAHETTGLARLLAIEKRTTQRVG
jgi:methylisocitrate lyase